MAKPRRPESVPEPQGSPDYRAELAVIRERLRKVADTRRAVEAAPFPRAEAEAEVRAWVAETAARHVLDLSWAWMRDRNGRQAFTLLPLPPAHLRHYDSAKACHDAFECAKDPEGATQHMLRSLDAQWPAGEPLTADERGDRLAALALEREALEVLEEFVIRRAARSGIVLDRRGDAVPEIVTGNFADLADLERAAA